MSESQTPAEKQAAKERDEYVEMKRERGEHVLAADCWCGPTEAADEQAGEQSGTASRPRVSSGRTDADGAQ